MHALMRDVLGHERCAAAGGDLGGGVIQDLGLRFTGFVERQVLFNSILPLLGQAALLRDQRHTHARAVRR
jgi:hypothetical protein